MKPASVSVLQTVGSEDKSLTVENIPEKPTISPSSIGESKYTLCFLL